MVVVVDESENENATADLEDQLAVLGERWSAICKWTEQRYLIYFFGFIIIAWFVYNGALLLCFYRYILGLKHA